MTSLGILKKRLIAREAAKRESLFNPHGMTDLSKVDLVEVRISPDGTKIWIDVDGINRFRVYNAKRVIVHDDR